MSKKNSRKPQAVSSSNQGLIALIAIAVLAIAFFAYKALPSANIDSGNAVNAPSAGEKQYSAAPEMTIDVNKQYFATFEMAKGGTFKVELYPQKAPITVNNFVFLARDGYYDGVTFHRVLDNFMAQGGDPTGTGNGGPGYQFVNEDSDLSFDKPGVVDRKSTRLNSSH